MADVLIVEFLQDQRGEGARPDRTYGTEEVAVSGDVLGARSGSVSWTANFRLFGGTGFGWTEGGWLNDLWKYGGRGWAAGRTQKRKRIGLRGRLPLATFPAAVQEGH